jgi:hypothetical protein
MLNCVDAHRIIDASRMPCGGGLANGLLLTGRELSTGKRKVRRSMLVYF